MTTLSSIEINPSTLANSSVIWLHGLGADGNDFVPIIPELGLPADLPVRFIFPNAPKKPVTINNGYVMPAWYDIVSLNIDQRADQVGLTNSVKLIEQFIDNEIKLGISSEKIILAGFSQGAVIALTTGLCCQKKLGGVIALSGYLPFAQELSKKRSSINQDMPIFVAHGTEDSVVPYALGENTCDFLKTHHYPVSWHSYSMPHSVCIEEIK